MDLVQSAAARAPEPAAYADRPNRSAWIAQMAPDAPPRPLDADADTDVAVIGAGIAGVATAFFILRSSSKRVLLLERDRVARGATGRNAAQLTTYFERPLRSIAAEFGEDMAIDGQRTVDGAHELLDLMATEAGATVRVERFTGHMGMFTLNHLHVHLRNQQLRQRGGLREEPVVMADTSPHLGLVPPEYAGLYEVVPQARIRELLEIDDDRYTAVLSARGGCANAGVLVQQVLAYLERRYPDRFEYHDRTPVDRIGVAGTGAVVTALGRRVRAEQVVLCTNGFVQHVAEDADGRAVELHPDQRVTGRIGYMAAFLERPLRAPVSMSYIRNPEIGGAVPYVYVTRRTYDQPDGPATLTCMGGPEHPIEAGAWHADLPFPGSMLATMDEAIRPFAQPARGPGLPYDFQWHGLMGYMDNGVRVVGQHPAHAPLHYNLGCNGVGFLPSIAGAERVARVVAGERLPSSIFDPR